MYFYYQILILTLFLNHLTTSVESKSRLLPRLRALSLDPEEKPNSIVDLNKDGDIQNEDKKENDVQKTTKDEKKEPSTQPPVETVKQNEETKTEKSDKSNQTKNQDIDIAPIKKEIEKYYKINKSDFDQLCSNSLLQNAPIQTLHISGKAYILTLDDHNLTFQFELNQMNKYYPKIRQLPYRCTSYCKMKQKNPDQKFTITRFKYNNYLIEFVNKTDHKFIKFYLENPKYLNDSGQTKHLIEVLEFTIEKDGCTSPINNPSIRDHYFDNLVTRDLIKIFCNKMINEKMNTANAFLLQEKNKEVDQIYKLRNIMFFFYPSSEIYNLQSNISKDAELHKTNLHNPVKGIRNAVQIKNQNIINRPMDSRSIDQQLFLTFTNQQMFILQESDKKTQLVEQFPTYAVQNFYTCPEPLCLDPYFDDLFLIKSCDFDLLFDFLPKASRLLFAFRGNYFYLINANNLKAPKIDQAIPIDYLFKEILARPDIDFSYLNAGEYVKKSEIIILFKDDQYILIDPLNKIINGPFSTQETFKYSESTPETVFMDGDYLIMISKGYLIKYLWSAPILTGKRDFNLDNYISFKSMNQIESNGTDKIPIIDAVFKMNDVYHFFVDDSVTELKFDKNGKKQTKTKSVSSQFFNNCKSTSGKTRDLNNQSPNLDKLFDNLQKISSENIKQAFRDNDGNETTTTTTGGGDGVTTNTVTNSSTYVQLNFLVQSLVLIFVNFWFSSFNFFTFN